MTHRSRARRAGAVAVIGALIGAAGMVQAQPAHAILGLDVHIYVDSDLGACGVISDRVTNASYTVVLTAVGTAQSGLGTSAITDFAIGTNAACTNGGITPINAAVEYQLSWTGAGVSGEFSRVCTIVRSSRTCSPEGV